MPLAEADRKWCWACGCDAPHRPLRVYGINDGAATCTCCGRPCNLDIELPPTRCEAPKCVAARVAERLTGVTELSLADLEEAYEAAKFGTAEPTIHVLRRSR